MLFKNNKGLTLTEVIIGLVLIGIISISVSSVYFSLIKASDRANERLEAVMIAFDELEQIKEQQVNRYLDIDNIDPVHENASIEVTEDSSHNKLKIVEVTVQLKDTEFKLQTKIYDGD